MVTFQDIKKANEAIKTTDIKGKDYAEVNQRIKAFRMVYPKGPIVTELISNENGICIFRAEVGDEEGNVLGTGTAYEKENSSFINKTSYIENCETSAVGRALGMAGFGIDTAVSSAEEVQNAIYQQEVDKKITESEAKIVYSMMASKGMNVQEVLKKKFNIDNTKDLTVQQYAQIMNGLKNME